MCRFCKKAIRGSGNRTICGTCAIAVRRIRIKLYAVGKLGGKCSRCGYDEDIRPLQCHHIDPSQKEFNISKAYRYSLARLDEELKKCILICANCHHLEHWDKDRNDLFDEAYKGVNTKLALAIKGVGAGEYYHGTASGYKNHKCRCAPCRHAKNIETRRYRGRLSESANEPPC